MSAWHDCPDFSRFERMAAQMIADRPASHPLLLLDEEAEEMLEADLSLATVTAGDSRIQHEQMTFAGLSEWQRRLAQMKEAPVPISSCEVGECKLEGDVLTVTVSVPGHYVHIMLHEPPALAKWPVVYKNLEPQAASGASGGSGGTAGSGGGVGGGGILHLRPQAFTAGAAGSFGGTGGGTGAATSAQTEPAWKKELQALPRRQQPACAANPQLALLAAGDEIFGRR